MESSFICVGYKAKKNHNGDGVKGISVNIWQEKPEMRSVFPWRHWGIVSLVKADLKCKGTQFVPVWICLMLSSFFKISDKRERGCAKIRATKCSSYHSQVYYISWHNDTVTWWIFKTSVCVFILSSLQMSREHVCMGKT